MIDAFELEVEERTLINAMVALVKEGAGADEAQRFSQACQEFISRGQDIPLFTEMCIDQEARFVGA